MRDPAAIVAPAVDAAAVGKRVRLAHIALRDAEQVEQRTADSASKAREEAGRRRLELGRALIEARKAWPARQGRYPVRVEGKTWLEWLADQGIEERNAQNWMRLAGFNDTTSETESDVSPVEKPPVPTLAESGIDKRTRKANAPLPIPPDDHGDGGDGGDADEAPESECAATPVPVDSGDSFLVEVAAGLRQRFERARLIAWHRAQADELERA